MRVSEAGTKSRGGYKFGFGIWLRSFPRKAF
jgi:hypothetical protein